MFEEVEVRTYHILEEKIKSYIILLYGRSQWSYEEADRAEEKEIDILCEYFNGYSHAINNIIRELNEIINGVERDTKKEEQSENV